MKKVLVIAFLMSANVSWKEAADCGYDIESLVSINALTRSPQVTKQRVSKVCLEEHHARIHEFRAESEAEVIEIKKCKSRDGFISLKCTDWQIEEVK